MFQRLLIALAQLKTGNTSQNLLIEIDVLCIKEKKVLNSL